MNLTPSRIPKIIQRSPTPLREQRLKKDRTLINEESKQIILTTI